MLFLNAGVINRTMHEQNINLLRGFGRNKHLLKLTFFIGLIGITGVPGFVGFASKTLLHEALVEVQHLYHSNLLLVAEILFVICSALTVVYMLKIFITLFVEKDPDYIEQDKKYTNIKELIPPIILGFCVIAMSLMTGPLLRFISRSMEYLTGHESTLEIKLYTAQSIFSAGLVLAIGIAAYTLLLRKLFRRQVEGKLVYFNPLPESLNLEESFYIPFFKILYRSGLAVFRVVDAAILGPADWITAGINRISEIKIRKSKRNFLEEFLQKRAAQKTAKSVEMTPKEAVVPDHILEESLKGIFVGLRYRFNSIIYGIFMFAVVLVVVLFVLVSQKI
jgi:NADH:ubiquinone oxidoreductase subunit 5 (subunit L)/multisubunit Na+/H+ antiporter MnhA subunit